MLKTKDNVDLKELEKYGFKYEQYYEYGKYYLLRRNGKVIIRIVERKLKLHSNNKTYSTLYDLIKDGLVEKIGDDK